MQLDGITIRIFDQDLLAARPYLHVIPKPNCCCLERRDGGLEVVHVQDDSVRTAWLLRPPVGQRPRTRGARPAEQQAKLSAGDDGYWSRTLHEPKGQLLGVVG